MRVDNSEDEEKRYNETWKIIYCFSAALIIHDLFLIYDTILAIHYFLKNFCYMRHDMKITNLRKVRNELVKKE